MRNNEELKQRSAGMQMCSKRYFALFTFTGVVLVAAIAPNAPAALMKLPSMRSKVAISVPNGTWSLAAQVHSI